MLKRISLFCAVAYCLATGSVIVSDVLDGPRGPVEFIGLEDWTASDLYKAIQETDPDKPFHACAAVMISSLEFPDAAAFVYFENQEDGSQKLYTVVIGVEDSALVQYREAGNETLDLPKIWQELQTAAEDDFSTLGTVAYVRYLMAEPDTARKLADMSAKEAKESAHEYAVMFGANAEKVDKVWALFDVLENSIDETDHRLALEVLEKDKTWSARFSATIILANYPERDSSWHGLADSMIDPNPQVRNVASRLIQGLIRAQKTVPVQWSEARETLLSLLGGTYPFAFNDILDVLVATEIDSELAKELVQERPKLLLGFVGADHAKFRESAHTFLKTISGKDFDRDVEAWANWINEKELESIP